MAQVVTCRPQITLSTIQGEQSAKSSFSSGLWQQCCGKSWQSRSSPCQVLVTAPFSLMNTKVTQTLFHKEGARRQAQSHVIFHCIRGMYLPSWFVWGFIWLVGFREFFVWICFFVLIIGIKLSPNRKDKMHPALP